MSGPFLGVIDHVDVEERGKDRDEAVARAFARMNAAAKGRRTVAEERLAVARVRRLGPNWWGIRFVGAVR